MIAILRDEPDGDMLLDFLENAAASSISAANLVETLLVLNGRSRADTAPRLQQLINDLGMAVVPVSEPQAWLAGQTFLKYGKGRHPARLNYGDCFAYALARSRDLPLLFKGNDFALTDIRSAL